MKSRLTLLMARSAAGVSAGSLEPESSSYARRRIAATK
jgi:hypothetical protein